MQSAESLGKVVEVPEGWGTDGVPLEIDLGCHRGAFLAGMAERFPETRWLGVEKLTGRVERCLAKFGRMGLENAWAIRGRD